MRALCDLAATLLTLFAAAVTHLPAPSGVPDASRQAVWQVWHTLGEVARAARDRGLHVPDMLASDKTIHFAIYLGPGALWACSLALRRRFDLRSALLLLGVLTTWAAADELSQDLLSREGQWGDWAANTLGAATGIAGTAIGVAVRRHILRRA